jgi:hypothetical protein
MGSRKAGAQRRKGEPVKSWAADIELCAILGDAARSSGAGFGVVVGDTVGECDALDDHWQLVRALQHGSELI